MATQSGTVEMQKIINQAPIDTLWIYWESDVSLLENSSTFTDTFSETFYLAENASDVIIVRTHDQLFSGNAGTLVLGTVSAPIPIGTYSVEDYDLIVESVGIISYVILNATASSSTINKADEYKIPRADTKVFEWIADTTKLTPFYDENDKCVIGCDYNNLTLRYPDEYPN